MTKDELNRKWAKLEGWEKVKEPPRNSAEADGLWWQDSKCKEIDLFCAELPDFTEPNRFLGDVVPRIKELMKLKYPYKAELIFEYSGSIVHAQFVQRSHYAPTYFPEGSGKSEGEAGLDAAIKAREALDV